MAGNEFQAIDGVATELEMASGVPDIEAFPASRQGEAVVNHGATRDEIFRLFEFAGEQDVALYTHLRGTVVEPIQEVVANAVATGASLHLVHLNRSGLGDHRTTRALALAARERRVVF